MNAYTADAIAAAAQSSSSSSPADQLYVAFGGDAHVPGAAAADHHHYQHQQHQQHHYDGLNVPYAVLEGLVAVGAAFGNGLVIVAFRRERRLRRRTNYYIVSLAVADLLVGLVGIPCAVLSSVGLPRHLHLCVFSVSLIIVLCTVSILSLVAVSADRYWAILYPMAYSTSSSTKTAVG